MNIQKIKVFVTAAELGSFTKAAEILNYSQSGVSRIIAELEKEWKLTLLERGKKGVKLTSDGMTLLPHARNVVREAEKLEMEVDALHGINSGLIRIGTFSSVATYWLPKMIGAFEKDYPNIEFELLLGDYKEIEEWILEGRVDCGFLRLPTYSRLETIFLKKDRLVAVIPEKHRLSKEEKFPVQAFMEEPFIHLEKEENSDMKKIFEKYGIVPKMKISTWDDYAVMSMVESGLGISVLPELIMKRCPFRVVQKPLDIPAYRKIGFAVREKKSASTAVKRFMDYLDKR